MNERERLVELLDDIQARGEVFTDYEIYGMRLPDTVSNEDVASHLIAYGVTVQEEAKPIEEWHEDYGDVLWWKFPIEEPPYVGSPLDENWPGYHTHWTPIVMPQPPKGGVSMATCKQCREFEKCKDDAFINGAKFGPNESAKYCTCFEPITNADRIRAMSDEELARFFADKIEKEYILSQKRLGHSENTLTATQIEAIRHTCYCIWKQWLMQPAEEEV